MISYLPKDIKFYLCSTFLDPISILNLSETSKEFLVICRDNKTWEKHVQSLCDFFGDTVQEYFKGVDGKVEYYKLYNRIFLRNPFDVLLEGIGGPLVSKMIVTCLTSFMIPNHNLNIRDIQVYTNNRSFYSVDVSTNTRGYSFSYEIIVRQKSLKYHLNNITNIKEKILLQKYILFMNRDFKFDDIKIDQYMTFPLHTQNKFL